MATIYVIGNPVECLHDIFIGTFSNKWQSVVSICFASLLRVPGNMYESLAFSCCAKRMIYCVSPFKSTLQFFLLSTAQRLHCFATYTFRSWWVMLAWIDLTCNCTLDDPPSQFSLGTKRTVVEVQVICWSLAGIVFKWRARSGSLTLQQRLRIGERNKINISPCPVIQLW